MEARVYVHMKGQFLRNIENDVARIKINNLLRSVTYNCYKHPLGNAGDIDRDLSYVQDVQFTTAQVLKVQKRPDSNVPCDPDIEDDDRHMMNMIMRKFNCMPSYWKEVVGTTDTANEELLFYPLCNTSRQLEGIYNYTSNIEKAKALYTPPCTEMTTVTGMDVVKKFGDEWATASGPNVSLYDDVAGLWTLKFVYLIDLLEHVEIFQDFNAKSCWSEIGGLVGIFVGLSLIQIPDMLGECYSFVRRNIAGRNRIHQM